MTLLQSILLGILQGLTEFLPISSSAHLVLIPYLLRWEISPSHAFVFDVLVQVATLLGVIAYFWADLLQILKAWLGGLLRRKPFENPSARLGWYLIIATIPAGVLGLLLKEPVERAFSSPLITAFSLFVTAGLLYLAERVGKRVRSMAQLNGLDALWMGCFQALAIFPGISRSGATITGGMTRDLERPAAARFAFLMSIPVMLAAGLVASLDLLGLPNLNQLLPVFIPGFIAAAVVGYLSIRWLLGYLIQHSLLAFSIYCALLGVGVFVIYLIR